MGIIRYKCEQGHTQDFRCRCTGSEVDIRTQAHATMAKFARYTACYDAERAKERVEHVLTNPGTKGSNGQLFPRPSCSCGAIMPEGIKTSPQGWHYGHKSRVVT